MKATVRYLDGPGTRCNSRCSCRCHTGKQNGQFRVSPFSGILGSLSMIYSGWQLAGSRCNVLSCRRARFKYLEVAYSTPLWPVSLSIIASLMLRDNEPTIGLTIRRTTNIVDEHNPQSILSFSKSRNVHEIRNILERRSNAVLDVTAQAGLSPLHFAFEFGYVDQAKILLAAGADPFLEDHWGTPVIFWAFQRMLHGVSTSEEEERWNDCLPLSAFFEEYSLSHIQLVVLGVRPLNLQVELNKAMYKAEVNVQDDLGKTPLHWAAIRNDVSAVVMLLFAGAHVDIRDKRDNTALYEACASNSEACAEKLVSFGANINARDKLGYCPLHEAAASSTTIGLLSLLLSNGAEMEDSRNP